MSDDTFSSSVASYQKIIQALQEENQHLKSIIEQLTAKIERLEAELSKFTSPHIPTSKQIYPKSYQSEINSSSSSDTSSRRRRRSSGLKDVENSGGLKRKRGGSKTGKSGITWDQETPAKIIHNYVGQCLKCGKRLDESEQQQQKIVYSKRVVDIPEPMPLQLLEYHVHQYECGCGTITQASGPTLEGTALGPNLLTQLTLNRYRSGASFENLSAIINDLSHSAPSQTIINRGFGKVAEVLTPEKDKIGRRVMNNDWLQIDETGHKLVLEDASQIRGSSGSSGSSGSRKVWVWTFCTPESVYYYVSLKRDKKTIEKVLSYRDPSKNLPVVVCDAYPAYINTFKEKQYCWAHLLRESKDIEDKCQAGKILHDRLCDLFQKTKAMLKQLDKKPASQVVYDKAVKEIGELAEMNGKGCKTTIKLQNHLRKRAELYLTCLKFPELPMENTRAERMLKSIILHRSNGKPLRSLQAMEDYGTVLTVLKTWDLEKRNLKDALLETILAKCQPRIVKKSKG
jgi:transposase